MRGLALLPVVLGLGAALARAQEPAPDGAPGDPDGGSYGGAYSGPPADAGPPGETIEVKGDLPPPAPGRPSSRVTRQDLDERQPRSAPDALRYEPGVYVQQTSAGQGSAFLRGRTGQQTLLLFDGIRLNNSLYRQGPNQYFFTIDLRSLDGIDVVRGGAATRYGSDAIGGVLDARPREPAPGDHVVRPSLSLRAATADGELGGRAQLEAAPLAGLTVLGGAGYRHVGLLESGGPVRGPVDGEPALVPRFDDDGRTQLGTGFSEVTADLRAVYRTGHHARVTAAFYDYRQLDAPRTDQCPPAYAPRDECLRFDEQFHTLGYLAFDGELGAAAEALRVTLSWQRQHERRTRDRPSSFAEDGGRDDVDTAGLAVQAVTAERGLGGGVAGRLRYGGDVYHDRVDSAAWIILTDIDYVRLASRGQYVAGSRYTTGGAFAELELALPAQLIGRGGARLAVVAAAAPADAASQTTAIDDTWWTAVGHVGLEWAARPDLALLVNADRSFRAPNLDDLTARQATGPGFQFENPALAPEIALTGEAGARFTRAGVRAEAWLFRSRLAAAIARAARGIDECPADVAECQAAWFRYQLVNLDGPAVIGGGELAVIADLPAGLRARATLAYARGDGPNPQEPPSDPTLPYEARVPLSRIPPLNGAVELRWQRADFQAAAALRWAGAQTRLAPADRSDPRIPLGGTPGFATVDLRAGWRPGDRLLVSVVLENILDAAYRYHGSSINGPGRGLILAVETGL